MAAAVFLDFDVFVTVQASFARFAPPLWRLSSSICLISLRSPAVGEFFLVEIVGDEFQRFAAQFQDSLFVDWRRTGRLLSWMRMTPTLLR